MQVLTDWLLTAERVAVHLPSNMAVVADLHLGYAEARRRAGEAGPVRSLEELLQPLAAVLSRQQSRRLVIAGDLLEAGRCHTVLSDFHSWRKQHALEQTILIPGNHDRDLVTTNDVTVGWNSDLMIAACYPVGEWTVIHGDGDLPAGRVVQGHEHPWFRCAGRLGAPCYLLKQNHLVLPAYSADAAGVNVLGVRRWRDYHGAVIVQDRVLDFGPLAALRRATRKTARRGLPC